MIAHEGMILFGLYTGLISHGRIRPHISATAQIINTRCQYERDLADPRVEADIVFFQILHDAGCRVEAKGTATA